MKIIWIISAVFSVFFISRVWAVPQSEVNIQGAKVTVQGGYLDLGVREFESVAVSTVTGQCMGILCAVTYKQ